MPSLATSYLDLQTSVPSDLRTAQWSALPVWCRERAFWVASLDQADTLDGIRKSLRGVLEGNYNHAEARARIREILNDHGYAAPEGLEGTIKDLRTDQRLDVMIRTNVEMARGWAREQQMRGSLNYPAKEFRRVESRKNPRPDWPARWAEAAAQVGYEGVAQSGMIALVDSPIWAVLNVFGNTYPPYDYNSGMGDKYVSYDECRRIGLITDDNEDAVLDRIEAQQPASLNDGLQAERDYRDQDLRDSISDSLMGLAKWEGNVLKFTDPNGTMPYDWREVGPAINADLPEGIPNLQATALRDWVNDHTLFEGDPADPLKAGLDEREDLARLINRIKPVNNAGLDNTTLYRGLTVDNDILSRWLDDDLYTTKPGKLADSWSVAPSGVQKYIKDQVNTNARHNVLLVMDDYQDVRPIHAAVREVKGIHSPNPAQILETDGEVLTLPRYGYEIVKKSTDKKTGLVTLTVRQIKRRAS